MAQPGFAQTAPAVPQTTGGPVAGESAKPQTAETTERANDEIVVTGSLIARNGFKSATPTTVLNPEELQNRAPANVADALNTLPSLRATLNPTAQPAQSNSANGNFLDLRGLGANRTLVLINGRRVVSSLSEGPTDINVIPQALIASVDVVTGGASAAYGSDAVAGVVNIKLADKLQGIQGSIQGGITDHDDHRNYRASLAIGQAFANGRGRLILAGEIAQNSGVLSIYRRDWGRRETGAINNPAYTATNSEPRLLIVDHAYRSNTSYGGVINAGPLRGIQFAPDGSAIPFRYGTLVTSNRMLGGDGAYGDAISIIETPSRRKTLYGRVSIEAAPDVVLFAEASYADSRGQTFSTTREDTVTIRNDNPFIPQSIRTALAANNLTSFTLGRFGRDYGNTLYNLRNRTRRAVVGVDAGLGSGWSLSAYYTHGTASLLRAGSNNRIEPNFALAVDATTDPKTGAAVCRDLAARAAGCVPVNLFGEGNISPQALSYITSQDSYRLTRIRQDMASVTLRGDLFSTWAGPISTALGASYRKDSTDVSLDSLSSAFLLASGSSAPYRGSVNVKEVFGEAVLPLAKDAGWAESLDLNLAGRVTDYSTSGTVVTWKAGATWKVNSHILARGTFSRDIRAPSLFELYVGPRTSRIDVLDPQLNLTYRVESAVTGNINLKPERANTFTAGIVLTDPFVNGLGFSVDYYDISVKDAIGTLDVSEIVRRCFADRPDLCSLITRRPDNTISLISVKGLNLNSITLRGVDFEGSYRTRLGAGRLTVRAIASYVAKLGYDDGTKFTRLDGSIASPFEIGTNGQPSWRGLGTVTFEDGPLTLYSAARFISAANLNNAFTSKDQDLLRVPSVTYFDVSAQYKIVDAGNKSASLFVNVQNLLDQDPPRTGVGRSNGTIYDLIGRTYTAGIRFKF